jgi:sulfatase maturation enzyme AslB (radical SAM superfamily)
MGELSLNNVIVLVTESCFFKCKMCHFWKQKHDIPIFDLNKYKSMFAGLKKFTHDKTTVVFTGGETLLNLQIYDLVKLASSQNIWTNLNTNAWLLDDKKIDRLIKSGVNQITISLDGSIPEIHDFIRGIPGSYKKIFSVIKQIRKKSKDIVLVANCVINNYNLNDVLNIVNKVNKAEFESVYFQSVVPPFASNDIHQNSVEGVPWYKSAEYKDLWPKDKKLLRKVYSNLIAMRDQGFIVGTTSNLLKRQYLYFLNPDIRPKDVTCTVNKDLLVDTKGVMFHCSEKNEVIGTIDEPIDKVLSGKQAVASRSRIKTCEINCHQLLNCQL